MTKRAVIILFATALIIKLALFVGMLSIDPTFPYDDDSAGYIVLAENLREGHGFSWDTTEPYRPNSFRTPGYPVFLLVHKVVFGNYAAALATQILLVLATAWLMLRIGARIGHERAGIVAAGVFLLMPFSLLATGRYLTQIVFTFLVTAATWCWLKYLKDHARRDLLIAAVLLPLAALVRPIAIAIVAPLAASGILASFFGTTPWKRTIVGIVVLGAVFVVGIAPWMLRNQEIFGRYALSSLVASQLYFYDDPAIYATAHGLSYEDARAVLKERIEAVTGIPVADYEPYMQFSPITDTVLAEGKAVALEDIPALVKTRATEFIKFFVRDGVRYWFERYGVPIDHGIAWWAAVAERVILTIIMLGFLIAAVRALMTRDAARLTLVLVVVYFALLSGVMSGAGFRYPAEPLLIVLGIVGLTEAARYGMRSIKAYS